MILEKDFESLALMNDFVSQQNVDVISIETVKKKYDTGMPLLRGGTFSYDKEYKRLYYQTKNNS